jgi:hypothetical protein
MAVVHIFRNREQANVAFGIPRADDGKFTIERNPFLENRAIGRGTGVIELVPLLDLLLPLSVIPKVCTLQNGGRTDRVKRSIEFRLIRNDGKRCVRVSMIAKEVFLPLAILADVKDLGPRMHRLRSRDSVHDLGRNIFEFESNYINGSHECLKQVPVCV